MGSPYVAVFPSFSLVVAGAAYLAASLLTWRVDHCVIHWIERSRPKVKIEMKVKTGTFQTRWITLTSFFSQPRYLSHNRLVH